MNIHWYIWCILCHVSVYMAIQVMPIHIVHSVTYDAEWYMWCRIGTLWIYIDTYDAHIVPTMNTHEYMWAHRFDVYVSMSIRSAHSINRLLLMHSVHTMWIDNETCDIYTFDVNVSMCIYMVHSMNRLLLRHSVHTMWIDNNTYDIYVSMSIHILHNMHRYCVCQYE